MVNALPRWVVVDDMNPSIQYSGSGIKTREDAREYIGTYGQPYLGTLHGTGDGSSQLNMTFKFNGTGVRVYGFSDVAAATGPFTGTPEWGCLIDGSSIRPSQTRLTNASSSVLFCDWRGGSPEEHALTLSFSPSYFAFWIDRIEYIPLSGASLLPGSIVAFECMGGGVNQLQGLDTIVVMPQRDDGGFKADLDFNGTKLSWWGTLTTFEDDSSNGRATAAYSIDSLPFIPFSLEPVTEGSPASFKCHQYFETSQLSPGRHHLTVVYNRNGDAQARGAPLHLSNLLVEFEGSATELPSPTQSAADGTGQQKKTPLGAIIGSVVGGLITIIATVLLARLLRRRSGKRTDLHESTIIEPFPQSTTHMPTGRRIRKPQIPGQESRVLEQWEVDVRSETSALPPPYESEYGQREAEVVAAPSRAERRRDPKEVNGTILR